MTSAREQNKTTLDKKKRKNGIVFILEFLLMFYSFSLLTMLYHEENEKAVVTNIMYMVRLWDGGLLAIER